MVPNRLSVQEIKPFSCFDVDAVSVAGEMK